MKFDTVKLHSKQERQKKFAPKDQEIMMEFTKQVTKELGGMVSAVVLFGSSTRKENTPAHDLDVLLILDDIKIQMSAELVQTYRIVIEKIISEVSKEKLHVQILHLTAWWGYVRAGDPVAINILREGFSIVDTGFFDPLQALLDDGKIRPSEEAIYTYMNASDASLFRADSHMINAVMDLYWAVIDASHAALMSADQIPRNPGQVADMLREVFVRNGKLTEKEAKTMEMFYSLSKEIVYKKLKKVEPEEFKEYQKLALSFVEQAKKLIEANLK